MAEGPQGTSVNRLAAPLVERLLAEAESLRLKVERPAPGYHLIDAGIACPGGLEAGRRIAEICLGGLGRVRLEIPAVLGSGRENWSEWAAPCLPYGGNDDTGMFLVPEEGASPRSVWAVSAESGWPPAVLSRAGLGRSRWAAPIR